jgi:5-methylcytosine-specific restriction endonuclease McrA
MDAILERLLRHPIAKKPYTAIRFSHFDQNGTPLYKLRKAEGTCGAKEALKRAFGLHGAHCFHCDKYHPKGELGEMTRDHVVPLATNGSEYLHNLLFACKPCNVTKGSKGLVSFMPEKAAAYLDALNRHLDHSVRPIKSSKSKAA